MNKKIKNRCKEIAKSMAPTIRSMRTAHVSFLIYKNRIYTIGWNKPKTHPINRQHPYHPGRVCLHAEADVILKSNLDCYYDFDLVVIRVDRNGNICNSRPCSGCRSLINQVGIDKVWYSNDQGEMEELVIDKFDN